MVLVKQGWSLPRLVPERGSDESKGPTFARQKWEALQGPGCGKDEICKALTLEAPPYWKSKDGEVYDFLGLLATHFHRNPSKPPKGYGLLNLTFFFHWFLYHLQHKKIVPPPLG